MCPRVLAIYTGGSTNAAEGIEQKHVLGQRDRFTHVCGPGIGFKQQLGSIIILMVYDKNVDNMTVYIKIMPLIATCPCVCIYAFMHV